MTKDLNLNVNGRKVQTVDVTYEDLLWLYRDFEKKNERLPISNECTLANNLPQQRIVNRVLKANNITFNEFMLALGKVTHVRCHAKDYNIYLEKYKQKCSELGRPLESNELTNNPYGLPSSGYFYKHCPDKSVKDYIDFVRWCGYSHWYRLRKEDVATSLINLEKKLGRPLLTRDISTKTVGFSMIVVNRIFGSFKKAKEEIGLMETLPVQPKPFGYYKNKLTKTLFNIKAETGRTIVTWADIENAKYNDDSDKTEHKTYMKSFKRNNVDIFQYMKSLGFEMNPSLFSFHYTFDDGERVVSTSEHDFSRYLKNELGMVYGVDYQRDVMYKTFTECADKKNCDYCINIGDDKLYVEIAGIIYNTIKDSWREHEFASKQENKYRDKMIEKENLLKSNNKHYLFFFPYDINSGNFKAVLSKKINEMTKAKTA